MTDQNTRPTPSSEVALRRRWVNEFLELHFPEGGSSKNLRAAIEGIVALSRLSPPAQVEVTDEMVERFIEASRDEEAGYRCWTEAVHGGLTAALTATDAKPVRCPQCELGLGGNEPGCSNAKPVAHEHIEVTDAGLLGFAEWFRKNYPGPDTIIHKPDWHSPKIYRAALHHARSTDAKPVVPAEPVAGWKLLPVEPDDGMIEAGEEEIACRRQHGMGVFAGDIYEAMVRAYLASEGKTDA